MASLESVRHKFYRSSVHFKELTRELEVYFRANPYGMFQEPDSPIDSPIFILRAKEPIPTRFALIAGDVLQNLRSCLDYLVWELVLVAGNTPGKKNMFPICIKKKGYEDALKKRGQLDGVDPSAVALIDGFQPLPQRGGFGVSNLSSFHFGRNHKHQ